MFTFVGIELKERCPSKQIYLKESKCYVNYLYKLYKFKDITKMKKIDLLLKYSKLVHSVFVGH